MRLIELTRGKFAQVDDEDFEWLSQWKWHIFSARHTYYAVRNEINRESGKYRTLRMHRQILRLNFSDGKQIDHADGNGLNNQRDNLRMCSRSENRGNAQKRKRGYSSFKGVSWHIRKKKWYAGIRYNCKSIWLGSFTNEHDAALAYNNAAIKLFGEFARLNEVDG